VVGLSYGGLLAQGLAYRMGASMSGLAVVVPSMAAPANRVLPEFRVIRRETVDYTGADGQTRESFEHMAVVQTQEHLRWWQRLINPGLAAADEAFVEELERNYEFSFDHRALPQPFEAPSLFVTGRQDNICGYQDAWKVLESYPRASFAVLDRAGHCLDFEQASVLEALVHDWIDRVEEYLAGAASG
jgi:pimeloyl-ACP methyl ester carboxylesterase